MHRVAIFFVTILGLVQGGGEEMVLVCCLPWSFRFGKGGATAASHECVLYRGNFGTRVLAQVALDTHHLVATELFSSDQLVIMRVERAQPHTDAERALPVRDAPTARTP